MASVAINVLDPEFYVDPWQAYRWLREQAPVYWDPVQKLWVISRYDDVLDVEKDTGRYSSSEGSRPLVDQREDMSMINMDDPGHQEPAQAGVPPVHAAGHARPREPRARRSSPGSSTRSRRSGSARPSRPSHPGCPRS